MRKFGILTVFTFLFFSSSLFAQTLNQTQNATSSTENNIFEAPSEWTFMSDEDADLFFVDLETFQGKMTFMTIENEYGEVVYEEDLTFIPDNTVFEIDLSEFEPGNYNVTVDTFTNPVVTELTISK